MRRVAAVPWLVAMWLAAASPTLAQPVSLLDAPDSPSAIISAPLAPIDPASPWHGRFIDAASQIFAALHSGDPARWRPVLGGAWLDRATAADIAARLADPSGPWVRLRRYGGQPAPAMAIFGWQMPAGATAADRAHWAARPEAEAIACQAADMGPGAAIAWPATAAAAMASDVLAPGAALMACVRISYSVRDGAARWRGFLDGADPAG